MKTADVLYYHSQQVKGPPEAKAFPEQLRLVVGMGSAATHTELGDPKFMCQVSMAHGMCTMWAGHTVIYVLLNAPIFRAAAPSGGNGQRSSKLKDWTNSMFHLPGDHGVCQAWQRTPA
jgi:hypothetical protein